MSRPSQLGRRLLSGALIALVIGAAVGACSSTSGAVVSFDPASACTTDGRFPGAYPDLEAQVPTTYQGTGPQTLDSGRNCTTTNLGSLADHGITELRFAGATWSFGAERAAVLAVFTAKGLTSDFLAEFYVKSAQAASRTTVDQVGPVTLAGRPGRRIDTTTSERLQVVLVWPSADPDTINVVIANDLPDARLDDAVAAFGGA
jgi:hypothetical protein